MRTDRLNLRFKKILGENEKKFLIFLLYPFRNKFILFNVSNRAKPNRINIDYWSESDNLGDTLGPLIVRYMLDKKNINPETEVEGCVHLYSVGSILTAGIQDATVWGSGVLNSQIIYRLKNRTLDVRAVRGPLTKAVLEDYGFLVPEVYGDPAILMPEIYSPTNREKKTKFGLVLHKDEFTDENQDKDLLVINIKTSNYRKFIDELVSVEVLISSSLHGIILAEAYGIPSVLLKPQKDMFKYYDYYLGTGRLSFPIATSIEEAMNTTPAPIPDFEKIASTLKDMFPYDIYLKERG